MIDKIRKIKESRTSTEEKILINVLDNLFFSPNIFSGIDTYTYNDMIVFEKNKKENILICRPKNVYGIKYTIDRIRNGNYLYHVEKRFNCRGYKNLYCETL